MKYLGFGFYFDSRAHQFKAKPHSYYTIEPTEDTEKIAVVMNYALANELFTYDAEAIE